MKSPDLSIVVPCLNEELNVQRTLQTVCAALKAAGCSNEILVIDDGSTDGTYQKACEYRDQHPEVEIRVHQNSRNLGLGASFYVGAELARGKYFRLCCGDNSEPVETLTKIFRHQGKADIIAPFQPIVEGRPFSRRLLSRSYTILVNLLSGHNLNYYNGCPLMLREKVLKWRSRTKGFGFQADMVTQMLDAGATVIEFPVLATERKGGKSKALTAKNVGSTAFVLALILGRRIRRVVFQRSRIPQQTQIK